MGKFSKSKGDRIERETVNAHKVCGLRAERYDARRGQFGATRSYDIDVYKKDRDAPLCGEIKARKSLPKWQEEALGDNDFLVLRANGKPPTVTLPWRVWIELLGGKVA